VTVTSAPAVPSVADVLRGDRLRRPASDRLIAAGLRADLEDRIFELSARHPRREPLLVGPRQVREEPSVAALTRAPTGQLRGVLVGRLLALLVVGYRVEDPFADAWTAWRADARGELVTFADQLDSDELARLAADVTAHFVTLERRLGSINPSWRPRVDVRTSVRFGGGDVVVRDVVDLAVGSTSTAQASVACFDVTTSPFGAGHERVLRLHALSETLRSHVAPLRVVSLSTATDELWSVDVDAGLLRRALDELTAVIERSWVAP
jgi:hypothetical protein